MHNEIAVCNVNVLPRNCNVKSRRASVENRAWSAAAQHVTAAWSGSLIYAIDCQNVALQRFIILYEIAGSAFGSPHLI